MLRYRVANAERIGYFITRSASDQKEIGSNPKSVRVFEKVPAKRSKSHCASSRTRSNFSSFPELSSLKPPSSSANAAECLGLVGGSAAPPLRERRGKQGPKPRCSVASSNHTSQV
jgi:hypothetical protein